MIRTEIDSLPAELDAITRRVMQLQIEEEALSKEKDKASKQRLTHLRKELQDLTGQEGAMREQYESEKQAIQEVRDMRAEEIEQLRREMEEAERNHDLARAAELKHGQIPELERRSSRRSKTALTPDGQLLREEVTVGGDRADRRALDRHPGDSDWSRASARSSSSSTPSCTSAWSGRMRRSTWSPMP